MLDLTGLPALDLAIGLAFIFFLLSTLAVTIQEFVASILGLRARTLEQGLRSMLEDPKKGWAEVDKFYDHPLIRSLYRTPPPQKVSGKAPKQVATDEAGRNAKKRARPWYIRSWSFFWRTRGPSYISPRSFALVVLDNFAPADGQKTVLDTIDELPPALRVHVKPLAGKAKKEVEELRTSLEAWYDDTMARVSGWYKRKSQIILLVIGLVIVIAVNANTITMGERMWKDDTVRAAVVAQATAAATSDEGSSATLSDAANDVDAVVKVGVPIGWRGEAVPGSWDEWGIAICGWLLTLLAISLGAPFWFDTLSRFSRLRSSGKPETPLPASGSGKVNERILTPPQAPTR
jgi:hypothetical protein